MALFSSALHKEELLATRVLGRNFRGSEQDGRDLVRIVPEEV